MELPKIEADLASRLRAEAHGMAESYLDALRSLLPPDSVVGCYVKGSAYRSWDSVIDYVPELSDVDIHVRLSPTSAVQFRTFPFALDLADAALSRFRRHFPWAVHTPRPQLFLLDDIERLPGYLASPHGCVHTLFGPAYRAGTRQEYTGCRSSDADRFRADARFFSEELPGKVVDRPGRYIWQVVSALAWRVAPAGPRLLTQLGLDGYDAWSLNRTNVVEALVALGCSAAAQAYADFYLAGWEGFGSRFEDSAPGRRAIVAANQLFAEGMATLGGRK